MATAQITIDNVAGSNDNIVYNATVSLANSDDTGVVTHKWTLLAIPAGSTATLDDDTSATPTFNADAEGTYLIRLVVNEGQPTEAVDQVIAAVRELQTGDRIPAAGETVENNDNSANTGWAYEAVDRILQRVTRMEDEGCITAVASTALTAGTLVRFVGDATIGTGTNERPVPSIAAANGAAADTSQGIVGYLIDKVGSGSIGTGDVCRVRLSGLIKDAAISASLTQGDLVYLGDAGTLAATGGTRRVVGSVAEVVISGSLYNIAFAGYSTSRPYGVAAGDLESYFPTPTVGKIRGVYVAPGSPTAGQVLRATGPYNAAWGAVDLADADAVTGTLPVSRGGTGASAALTQGGVVYGNTTSAMGCTAAGTAGYLLKSNGTGAPSWLQTVPVANGGTGTSSAPTQYGLIYAASTTAYGSTLAGNSSQVLIGNASGAPTWGTVPTGAFAESSVPKSSLQRLYAFNRVATAPAIPVLPSNVAIATRGPVTLNKGLFTFGIMPLYRDDTFPTATHQNYVTSIANNHVAVVNLQFSIQGPAGFNPTSSSDTLRTYMIEVQLSKSHSTNQIVGQVPLQTYTDVTDVAGTYTITAYASVSSSDETWTLTNYALILAQG